MKESQKNTKCNKLISLLFYLLPIIFFIISYFLITTSGEDIHQGAGNLSNGATLAPLQDASNAFNHSGRITDMYAWVVIDLFDYQFSFGIDTIFRLFDVFLISASLYLSTYIVLGRRPKLLIRDSLTFCAIFVAIVFSMFGRRLYSEFSMIHNYVPLVFITLLFSIPYLRFMLKKPIKNRPQLLPIIMLLLGFLFGMSTTITPLAFLVVTIIYIIVKHKTLPKIPIWFYSGLVGLIIGFCISFFLSSGMNSYTTNPISTQAFDYVSINDFFTNPFQAIPRLIFHLIYNSALVLLPLIVLLIAAIVFSGKYRQIFIKHSFKPLSENTRCLILVFSLFILIHLLATIQIKSPPRILIPAYLSGIILIFKLFTPYIKSALLGKAIIFFTISAIVLHTTFLSIYHARMASVLTEIKNTPEGSTYCIEHSVNNAPRIPLINLSQEFMVVDWGYPEPIYGKDVIFCPSD